MSPRPARNDRAEIVGQIESWGSFILANMLWVLFTVPIITMPAATAGLFAVMSKRANGQSAELFAEFFGGMRRLWRKATLIMLLNIVVVGLAAVNFAIFPRMSDSDPILFASRSVTLFVGITLLLVNVYVWPLLVTADLSLRGLIEGAFRLVLAYPLWSVGILAAGVLPILISLVLPQAVFLVATFATSVLIINMGAGRIIRRHLPTTD